MSLFEDTKKHRFGKFKLHELYGDDGREVFFRRMLFSVRFKNSEPGKRERTLERAITRRKKYLCPGRCIKLSTDFHRLSLEKLNDCEHRQREVLVSS